MSKMNKAISTFSDEAISDNRNYEIMDLGISFNQLKNLDFGCTHCNVNVYNLKNKPLIKIIDRHKITITKNLVSFTCPAHGGWSLSLKKKDIPYVGNLNLDKNGKFVEFKIKK